VVICFCVWTFRILWDILDQKKYVKVSVLDKIVCKYPTLQKKSAKVRSLNMSFVELEAEINSTMQHPDTSRN
jgi:hypothetical protein